MRIAVKKESDQQKAVRMCVFSRLNAENKILVVRGVYGTPMNSGLFSAISVRKNCDVNACINATNIITRWKVFTGNQKDRQISALLVVADFDVELPKLFVPTKANSSHLLV